MSDPERGCRALERAFAVAAEEGRAALVPYLTAGFPSRGSTLALLEAAARGGADVIEIGIPFSDPIADGPTIQRSSQRALADGFRMRDAFEALREFRGRWGTPVVVFSYLNPLLALGVGLTDVLRAAGADGALIVDLSFEDGESIRRAFAEADLACVPLLAPTTSAGRLRAIAAEGSGFLYVVSMSGVTGQQLTAYAEVGARVATLKATSSLPVAVGFGVRTAADVAAIARLADGVVIGSEIVRRLDAAGPSAAPAVLEAFVAEVRPSTSRAAG